MNPGLAAARFLTASPGRTALIGAGIGGAAGALRAPPGQRAHGALGGALQGAAIGGIGGGIGRAYRDTRLLNPATSAVGAIGETAMRGARGLGNFAKRQVHGAVGAFDHDAIGMAGNATSGKKVDLLKRRAADELAHAHPNARGAIEASRDAAVKGELAHGARAQSLADAGVTNLPGMARALATPGRRADAFRAMGRSVSDGPGGALMSLGVPAAVYGPELMKGDESAQGGMTLGQKARRAAAGTAAGVAFAGMPVVAQGALSIGAERLATHGFSRRPPAPQPGMVPQ